MRTADGTEDGLLGCWALDEGSGSEVSNKVTGAKGAMGVYDSSWNLVTRNRNFTWAPTVSLASTFANNSGSRIQTDVKITTSDFTVEAWARFAQIPTSLCYMLGQYVNGNKDTWFALIFDNAYPRFRNGSSGSGTTITSSKAIVAGRWFHLAATRSGTAMARSESERLAKRRWACMAWLLVAGFGSKDTTQRIRDASPFARS